MKIEKKEKNDLITKIEIEVFFLQTFLVFSDDKLTKEEKACLKDVYYLLNELKNLLERF